MNLNYLYRHIRPDKNEVFYIGIGKENTKRAWETRHRTKWWHKIVDKNKGIYEVEIMLTNLTEEQANEKEVEFISIYGRKKDNSGTLVNLQKGGKGFNEWKMSEEQRKELVSSLKGNKRSLGYRHSKESKLKMSAKGMKNKNNLGNKATEETKKRMSESHKGNTSTKGMVWINNGIKRALRFIKPTDNLPEGWILGKGPTKLY